MRRKAPVAALFCVCILLGGVASAETQDINVSPTSLDFGSLCLGQISAPKTVTVSNTTTGGEEHNLVIEDIEKTGGSDKQDFANSSLSPQSPIPPGGSSTFTVTFSPSARGLRDAKFTISSNDSDEPAVDVSVKGTGLDRRISADASTVAFGDQRVGTRSPTKTLIVRNPGGDTVTVTSVKRAGQNPADFIVAPPAVPFTIPPGGIKEIGVAFQPSAGGLRKASLEISSNACGQSSVSVALVGTGVLPNLLVEPNPIDAGTAPVGGKTKPTTITVTNNGQAALKVTTVQILGTDAADFALSGLPTFPKTLQPDEFFLFNIRMLPTEEGLRLGTINVLSDDPDVPTFSVPVRGTATAASPSPSASATASASASASASPTGSESPRTLGGAPNDSLAIFLVVGGVLFAFVGLIVVRRFIRTPEDADL